MARTLSAVMVLTALLAAGPALAGHWGWSWESIAAAGRAVETMQAKFVQRKELKMLQQPLVSHGRLLYRAPASVRWEYTAPVPSVAILTPQGSNRYTRDDDAWQRDRGPTAQAMDQVLGRLRLWLRGEFRSDQQIAARLKQGHPPRIVLEPQEKLQRFFQRVVLTLGLRPGVIERVEIVEYQRGSTIMEFGEIKINQPLPAGAFAGP